MQDTSVSPPGLFALSRSQRLLASLESRSHWWADRQAKLIETHLAELAVEQREHEQLRQQKADACRQLRRETLSQWDESDETLIHEYEVTSVTLRQDLNRLAAIYRRKLAEEKKNIERKVEARRQAVLHQYENQKNQPGIQKRKEIKAIDSTLVPLRESVEAARSITVQRLERLPEVPESYDEPDIPEPKVYTVTESIAALEALKVSMAGVLAQMRSGFASKIIDTFYLPLGVVLFMGLWAAVAYFVAPDPPWLAMGAGGPIAGLIGFVIYLVLLLPLKRMTRELFPKVERVSRLGEACAEAGRRISTRIANETAAELVQRRDSHLDAAHRWRIEHLAETEARLAREEREAVQRLQQQILALDQQFNSNMTVMTSQMRGRAEEVAATITRDLSDNDARIRDLSDESKANRQLQLHRLRERLRQGLDRGLNRILSSQSNVNNRFPAWPVVQRNEQPVQTNVDYLPIGGIDVHQYLSRVAEMDFAAAEPTSNGHSSASPPSHGTRSGRVPDSIPVVLHRRLHSGLVIHCPPSQLGAAIDVMHQMLWRLLTGAKPGHTKLTLIDPLGRGQNFTNFMALADHDPSLVNHRVWTSESNIESRLGELAHRVEDVLQTCLRDRFARIEDYNAVAGPMAEPYRCVAAIGLPEGLSREGYKYLRALLESGNRCGVMTLLVCDSTKPWPNDMPLPCRDRMLGLNIDDRGDWRLEYESLSTFALVPETSPPVSIRSELAQSIGKAAAAAARVEIPLTSLLPSETDGNQSTRNEVRIPVGSQGANRTLSLQLGEGVRQHTLIAGKTGSGKSTLLHAIICAGMHQYLPSELQYYLLDFKKGVEFKLYADSQLAHMRVIGIESEREFGRSVLQRLDAELQFRGELFRAAGVQDLRDYRDVSGKALPRLMLVVDEFQELFLRDDRIAADCAMLLDRLVRQGRSFGMHVVLSSQSLAGAYSLPRATLGQMAVRIALQCSDADAAMILSDDNTAARLLSRPGEAIYNDAGGLVEGNHPFQVAWLAVDSHRELLRHIARRDADSARNYPPTIVFEGNRPARWSTSLVDSAVGNTHPISPLVGLLGEAVEIGPPVSIELNRNAGRNVLMVGTGDKKPAVLASLISSMAKGHPDLKVVYFDGSRADDPPSIAPWLVEAGLQVESVKPREAETQLKLLTDMIGQRADVTDDVAPHVIVIDPLDRFRDLRQDDSFSFNLDSASAASAAGALQSLLRDGPNQRVFTILVCNGAETLSRWLPRASQHDLELRVLGVLNATDSSMLIDTPAASDLSAATMLVYDDADGKLNKFRFVNQPNAHDVRQWLENHEAPSTHRPQN